MFCMTAELSNRGAALFRFQVVRKIDSNIMAAKITSNPAVAFAMLHCLLGRMDRRPYTNSMCTQYTSKEVFPS